MNYERVDASRADQVAQLAVCLTNEISERVGVAAFDVDGQATVARCEGYLRDGHYDVVGAFEGDDLIGFVALCESRSLYANGVFGIIQEFYVRPAYRSHGVGAELVEEAMALARDRGWRRLELCTPPVPEFDRTVAFYRANGFEVTGGYKMKRHVE